MYFTCEHCMFQFEHDDDVTQCPDCGKFKVRPSTQSEIEEYIDRKNNPDEDWG